MEDIQDIDYCPIMDSGYKKDDKYKEDLYHATVNLKNVCESGLKSRYELIKSSSYQSGLGGSPSDYLISFTSNPKIAKSIANTMKTLVLMSTWDADSQDFVISFDNLPEWLEYNEEFSNEMNTDNILDRLTKFSKYENRDFGIPRGVHLTYSDIWYLLDKEPELCNITESGWTLHITKEEWENLRKGNIFTNRNYNQSRKKWQVQFPSEKGYEVLYPTKEMAREGIESPYAYIHTENKEQVQQELIKFWNRCYNGLREVAGGIPNPIVYTEEMRDLAQIDPDNIGVVKVTASLPYSLEDIKKAEITLRYASARQIERDSTLTDEEKIKMIEDFQYANEMKDKLYYNQTVVFAFNDKSLEEIKIGKSRISNLTIVDIRDPYKKSL